MTTTKTAERAKIGQSILDYSATIDNLFEQIDEIRSKMVSLKELMATNDDYDLNDAAEVQDIVDTLDSKLKAVSKV